METIRMAFLRIDQETWGLFMYPAWIILHQIKDLLKEEDSYVKLIKWNHPSVTENAPKACQYSWSYGSGIQKMA